MRFRGSTTNVRSVPIIFITWVENVALVRLRIVKFSTVLLFAKYVVKAITYKMINAFNLHQSISVFNIQIKKIVQNVNQVKCWSKTLMISIYAIRGLKRTYRSGIMYIVKDISS